MPVLVMLLIGVLLVLGGAGCAGSDDSQSEGAAPPAEEEAPADQEPAPEEEEAPPGAGKFTGQDRRNYEDAKAVCSSFPPKQVARELGIKVDVRTSEGLVRIAERYAEDYRPNFRQAVFEGCLDGLPDAE